MVCILLHTIGVLCLCFLHLVAVGQKPGESSLAINVSATVTATGPVELITLRHIVVGSAVAERRTYYLSPVSGADAGLLQIKGRAGSSIRVSWLPSGRLTCESVQGRITIAYHLAVHPERVQHAATLVEAGDVVLHLNETGLYYLWIGGFVNMKDASPGRYTGEFTIEIDTI